MPSDWVFIAISIFSLAGIYLISQANLRNYFKKKNFDLQIQAEKLKLQKIKQDLGLKKGSTANPGQDLNTMDLLKNIDMDQIKKLIGMVQKKDDDIIDIEPEEQTPTDLIMQIANDHPELVQQFLGSIGKKGSPGQEKIHYLGE